MKRIADAALEPLDERFKRDATFACRTGVAAGPNGVFDLLAYGPDLDGTQCIARVTVDPFSGEAKATYFGASVIPLNRPERFPEEVMAWADEFIASHRSLPRIRLEGPEGFEAVVTLGEDGREYAHIISDDVRARALITKIKALEAGRSA
jgi:hypothetical protein